MQLVFKKNEDNVNEIFASLRNTGFNEFITEMDESDILSENLDSEPSSNTNINTNV